MRGSITEEEKIGGSLLSLLVSTKLTEMSFIFNQKAQLSDIGRYLEGEGIVLCIYYSLSKYSLKFTVASHLLGGIVGSLSTRKMDEALSDRKVFTIHLFNKHLIKNFCVLSMCSALQM